MIWRCATRIEKGKEECANSPTIDDEWVQDVLSEAVCENSIYDEGIIRSKIDKIQIFDTCIMICFKDGQRINIAYNKEIIIKT